MTVLTRDFIMILQLYADGVKILSLKSTTVSGPDCCTVLIFLKLKRTADLVTPTICSIFTFLGADPAMGTLRRDLYPDPALNFPPMFLDPD